MAWKDRTPEIKAGHLLDVIRERPALYLGNQTLTGLWHFLHGFDVAEGLHGVEGTNRSPRDFHDWVAYRLHYYESTKGWARMILEQTPDESAAFERFYQLLDEYRARNAQIVATITGHKRGYTTHQQGQDLSEATHDMIPEKMVLVSYTDDPGLFLTGEGHFPQKDWLFRPRMSGIKGEMINVVDQSAFDRWLQDDPRSGSSLSISAPTLFR